LEENVQYYPTSLQIKAITMVAHGLNVKPSAMLALIEWLNLQGSDAYLVRLSGHYADSANIHAVTSSMWETDMLKGYTIARKSSTDRSVPLFFLGYSLGALLGQAMISFSQGEVHFDKQVLFAPATAMRRRAYVIKLLFVLNGKLMLPSYTPIEYRANSRIPVNAYKILFKNRRNILKTNFNKLNIPTIIFIDPKDELVSYKKLAEFSGRYALTDYQVVKLDSDLRARGGKYHHLIINKPTMGENNWVMVTQKMAKFLFHSQ
jgi:esterase/lipase